MSAEPIKYDAFLSYARVDDAKGDIRKLHAELELELQQQWKRNARIFFDRGITAGHKWRDVIERSLHESSFCLCILSRSFFESKECREEVNLFMEKSRSHGKDPHLVPVRFASYDDVEHDDFFHEVTSRQHRNYSRIRLKKEDAEEFREFVLELGESIATDLRGPAKPAQPTPAKLRQSLRTSQNESYLFRNALHAEEKQHKLQAEKAADFERRLEAALKMLKECEFRLKMTSKESEFYSRGQFYQLKNADEWKTRYDKVKQELEEERRTVTLTQSSPNNPEPYIISLRRFVKARSFASDLARPGKRVGDRIINPMDGTVFVWIPAGDFLYGIDKARKSLPGFWIAEVDVTWGQYKTFCKETGHILPSIPDYPISVDHPVVFVGLQEALDYAVWAGAILPSQAQWEKAARGTDGRTYPWGNTFDPSLCHSSVGGNMGSRGSPAKVGSYPKGASIYGCLDMAGNVWQWVLMESEESKMDARVRGGSWRRSHPGDISSCEPPMYLPVSAKVDDCGFRLAGPLIH